jgi:hypothetical protein
MNHCRKIEGLKPYNLLDRELNMTTPLLIDWALIKRTEVVINFIN